ncbi:MAG: hypothetical protein ACKOX2_19525 [Microcystaceae cyanobacterium]
MKGSSLGLGLAVLGLLGTGPGLVTAQSLGGLTSPASRTAIAPLQVPQALPPTISPDDQALRHLPAPPPLIANERITTPPNGQELVFQRSTKTVTPKTFASPVVPAPVQTPPIASDARPVPSNPGLYRVQVMGNSPQLLAQVRKIEPLAFIREADNTIQAGTFPEASLAQQRIHLLTEQGIPAQLVNVPDAAGMPSSSMALRYQIR